MHKKINGLLVLISISLIIYIISTFIIDMGFYKNNDIKLSHENIFIISGEEVKITSSYEIVTWSSDDESIAKVTNGIITGVRVGTTKVHATSKNSKTSLTVNVTDLITAPTLNNAKSYLKCNQYSKNDAKMLDDILEYRISEAGLNTRAGALAAARFLTLEFPYRISYFYENGRLLTNNTRPYVDGEGRYYHKGLYLSEDKFSTLKASMYGPAIWGCELYSRVIDKTILNGLNCSGFVSWALFNGGFDVGDAGAGINANKDNDLDDLGEKLKINKENLRSDKYKVGDLLSTYGHIGMLIGKDDSHYYIAESLDYDLHVLKMTESELLESEWLYIILLDELYKEDGNLTNMWE